MTGTNYLYKWETFNSIFINKSYSNEREGAGSGIRQGRMASGKVKEMKENKKKGTKRNEEEEVEGGGGWGEEDEERRRIRGEEDESEYDVKRNE